MSWSGRRESNRLRLAALRGGNQRLGAGTSRCAGRGDRSGTGHPGVRPAARTDHQAEQDDKDKRDHGQAAAPQPAPPRLCPQHIIEDTQLSLSGAPQRTHLLPPF